MILTPERLSLALIAFLLSFTCSAETYDFGIVPQQSASKTARHWVPILKFISERSGHKLVFKTAKNIPTFEHNLSDERYDFAYMNPLHYVIYQKQSGYQAILKDPGKQIRGIIVVHHNSPLKTLNELQGTNLAFPSPNAFAASILTQAELRSLSIDFTPSYVASHDSVYRNVHQQRFVAGGGVIRTLNNMPEPVREELRVLWTSRPYTPHAIAAHQRIPAQHREAIQQAFIDLKASAEGQQLLKRIGFTSLDAANDSDWNDVRQLKTGVK